MVGRVASVGGTLLLCSLYTRSKLIHVFFHGSGIDLAGEVKKKFTPKAFFFLVSK